MILFLPLMEYIGTYHAKTHLSTLLDRVAHGETFLITRQGKPAARLLPASAGVGDSQSAVEELLSFGKKHRGLLRGIPFRTLIDDGRRL